MTAATVSREHPILFSGPMILAIQTGRKSQTRRVVTDATSQGNYRASLLLLNDPRVFVDPGPSPAGNPGPYLHAQVNCEAVCARRGWTADQCDPTIIDRLYPRYAVGDQLWVREAFFDYDSGEPAPRGVHSDLETRALIEERIEYRATPWTHEFADPEDCGPWKPSIHMPRWASRLTLEVTEVRAERIQDISKTDAIAEGIDDFLSGQYFPGYLDMSAAVANYRRLWDSINAKRGYSWDTNPWVWALSFARVEA